MLFDECSAAMSFQVGFKSTGFFFVFKGNRIFDTPRFVFGCVRNIAFVVLFQTGFLGAANIKMGSGCFVNENVNVMKAGHNRESLSINTSMIWKFCGMMLRIILIFSTICVHIRNWECSLRGPQKQNFQSKNKRAFWNFSTEFVQNTLTIPTRFMLVNLSTE